MLSLLVNMCHYHHLMTLDYDRKLCIIYSLRIKNPRYIPQKDSGRHVSRAIQLSAGLCPILPAHVRLNVFWCVSGVFSDKDEMFLASNTKPK